MANSYERIRQVVIDTIENTREGQFDGLKEVVAATLAERSGDASSQEAYIFGARLSYEDSRMFTEVFWELFREGIITLGLDADNPSFPWFRASRGFDENLYENVKPKMEP